MRNIPYIMIVGIFRSGGDTIMGMKLDLFSQWALSIPATFLAAFVFDLPFIAVFAIMYIFEDYLKSFLCLRHFFSERWIQPVTEEGRHGYAEYRKRHNRQA